MRSHTIFFSFAALFSNLAISNAQSCTADQRLAGAEAIPYAYNLTPLGAAAAAFNQVPFASDCTINMSVSSFVIPVAYSDRHFIVSLTAVLVSQQRSMAKPLLILPLPLANFSRRSQESTQMFLKPFQRSFTRTWLVSSFFRGITLTDWL